MGLKERLEENAKKKKLERTSEEKLRDTFNEASTTLINQYMAKVQAGAIEISDVGDLTRLFQIYMQINKIDSMAGEGNGTLPALPSGQKEIISSYIETSKADINGEEEEVISLVDLAGMDEETIDKMLVEKEIQMNKENEATF